MNTRTGGLALLSVIVFAAVVGSFVFMQSTVKADNNAVASDEPQAISSVNATDNGSSDFNRQNDFIMEHRFNIAPRGIERGCRGFGPEGIQVSSEFTQNVTNIAKLDSDVQNLLSQGFNITSVQPLISTVIDVNGNVITKASTANLMLIGNNGSRAFVVVDLSQEKVTKIVALTITEINK